MTSDASQLHLRADLGIEDLNVSLSGHLAEDRPDAITLLAPDALADHLDIELDFVVQAALEIEGVSKSYFRRHVLAEVSFGILLRLQICEPFRRPPRSPPSTSASPSLISKRACAATISTAPSPRS